MYMVSPTQLADSFLECHTPLQINMVIVLYPFGCWCNFSRYKNMFGLRVHLNKNYKTNWNRNFAEVFYRCSSKQIHHSVPCQQGQMPHTGHSQFNRGHSATIQQKVIMFLVWFSTNIFLLSSQDKTTILLYWKMQKSF